MTTWQKWKLGVLVALGFLAVVVVVQVAAQLLVALGALAGQVLPEYAASISQVVAGVLGIGLLPFLFFEVARMSFPYLRSSLESRP